MKSFVIKKWIEPYKLLETIKGQYEYEDYTFDGKNKLAQKELFFESLKKDKNNVGLYMKNVNKFYLFSRDEYLDIIKKLSEIFELSRDDIEENHDVNDMFSKIDLGKAEAELIIP